MKSSFVRKISQKRIILWGTGTIGHLFYENYKNKLDIVACTSNEKNIEPIERLKVISPVQIKPGQDFIIVCSSYYPEIRNQLMSEGYEVGLDFIGYDSFEKLYEREIKEKKIIIAVGQCEIYEICQVLNMLNTFVEKYCIFYFDEQKVCCHGNNYDLAETKECLTFLQIADFFIKPSVLEPRVMNSFQFLRMYLNGQCESITISLFNMDSYWAQDIANQRAINKFYITKRNQKLCAYVEKDQVIEQLIDEGYSVNEILSMIKRDDFFDYNKVIENHHNCIKRAKITDRLSTIKMSEFVEKNYNLMKLYCDRGHFHENLLREYAKRVLQFFSDKESIKKLLNMDISCITQNVNELPIYPSTARILNLEWINENTLYRQRRYDGVRLVTFEEYMEAFIQYCKYAKEVLKYTQWSS